MTGKIIKSFMIAVMIILTASTGYTQVTFSDQTDNANVMMDSRSRYSTGQAWGDYNNDGYIDVYITSWGQAATGLAKNALYRNLGNGRFIDVASTQDIGLMDNSTGAAFADFDNDGDLDLFVANFSEADVVFKNLLMETGSAVFSDVTSSMNFINLSVGSSKAAVWGDYNNDGFLDLYVSKFWGKNALYRNNNGISFAMVSGAFEDVRDSEWASWVDYDDDGDVDLYVVNREQENRLFRNDDGTLISASTVGINSTIFGRSCTWVDYDNNNRLDLFLSNIGANSLYEQSPGRVFSEIAASADVQDAPSAWDTWCAAFGDYDCDGYFDLVFVGGFDETSPTESFSGTYGNILLKNSSGIFVDKTDEAGMSRGGFYGTAPYGSFASSAAFTDYDSDGDPDLFITNTLQNLLYRNDNTHNGYLKVSIDDRRTGFNRNGLGAKVRVYNTAAPSVPVAMQEIMSGPAPMYAHFGLVPSNVIPVSSYSFNVDIVFLKSGTSPATTFSLTNITVPLDTIIVIQ
ncbi:FG-GAP repeat domain-containing protein [candidate division KSB1 bacterium]